MSMSTQEANDYLSKLTGKSEAETPSVTAKEPEEATPPKSDDAKPEQETKGVPDPEKKDDSSKGSDEPKSEKEPEAKEPEKKAEEKQEAKNDDSDKEDKHKSQRDYAFIREKNKRKEQKAKYEAQIKELNEQLEKYKNLKLADFKDKDGKEDTESYVNWKLKEREMQDEIKNLQTRDLEEQRQYDLEEDRRRVNACFEGKDLEEYDKLISEKGSQFYEAVTKADPNGVFFNYLNSIEEYPIVLRELMTDLKLLSKVFRSKDPDILKYNTARIADEILERHHKPKEAKPSQDPAPEKTAQNAPKVPVIGKQVSAGAASQPKQTGTAAWNEYLRKHPRG